jgi:prevent-host-death family protein
MKTVGVYEAKTQLPRLLVRVARGERITITRHGVPVATIVPVESRQRRPIGHVVADLQVFARGRRLGRLSLRRLIESGRR